MKDFELAKARHMRFDERQRESRLALIVSALSPELLGLSSRLLAKDISSVYRCGKDLAHSAIQRARLAGIRDGLRSSE